MLCATIFKKTHLNITTLDTIKLILPWATFSDKADKIAIEGRRIYDQEKETKTEEDLERVKSEINKWVSETTSFFKESFDKKDNEYANSFYNARYSRYSLANVKNLSQRIKEEFEDLGMKINNIWSTTKLLGVCDAIINSSLVDELKQRDKYTTQDKLTLLLNKLYDLYDDFYYPIKDILIGNGIKLKRYDEDRELCSILEEKDFIHTIPSEEGLSAQLTANGAIHVEDFRKSYKEDYSDINKTSEELNEKIDQIIYELRKQGLGQEIIYNEIDELKDLYTKVSKKTWGQALKGKLFDIGLSQALDKDTVQFIYEQLTNHQLRLL